MNLIKYRNYRENDKTLLLIGLCFLFSLFILFQCTDRDRNNIFDPSSGIDSLDIRLYITSADSIVTIKWYSPAKIQYIGYNLYRKAENEDDYNLIASFTPDQSEYIDEDVSNDISYKYYLRIVGEDNESPPTKI